MKHVSVIPMDSDCRVLSGRDALEQRTASDAYSGFPMETALGPAIDLDCRIITGHSSGTRRITHQLYKPQPDHRLAGNQSCIRVGNTGYHAKTTFVTSELENI